MHNVVCCASFLLINGIFVCSSMVIRDLTLRSAPSFGSFHIIHLLFDEYMFYLVERKMAAALDQTSISVISGTTMMLSTDGDSREAETSDHLYAGFSSVSRNFINISLCTSISLSTSVAFGTFSM